MNEIDLNFLPQTTRIVFEKLSEQSFMKSFTLVGGTALALQLKHRLSEDLDFISDEEVLKNVPIKRNIGKYFPKYKIIKEDKSWQIDIIIDDNIKVTWFSSGAVAADFKTREYAFNYKNLWIARPEIIAVHKLMAISQRNTIRDYYDIYYLAKYYTSLSEIFKLTRKLNPNLSPVTYSETLIYTDDLQEENMYSYLKPKENITKQELSAFFLSEIKKIRDELK